MTDLVSLETRHVAFLDILGFKKKIDDPVGNDPLFKYLIDLPQRLPVLAQEYNWIQADVQCTAFSDSIVVSARVTDNEAVGMIPIVNRVKALFWEFIERRAVIRGAVARGPLYHRAGVAFGRAMNDVVDLEKDVALFSRVVVQSAIGRAWRAYFGQRGGLNALTDEIREDRDGVFYIDLFHFPEDDSLDKATYRAFQRSGPVLTAMLADQSMGLKERSKVTWLASQFNQSHLVRDRHICSPVVIPPA
jgi:hypothetical protein